MKKHLLSLIILGFALSVNAQIDVQDNGVENKQSGYNQEEESPVVTATAKPHPIYRVPVGTYFASYAKNGYRLNYPMLHVPAFSDLTFANVSTDATSYIWNYVDPETEYSSSNPLLESTEKDITVNYSYLSPTTVPAPVLTAVNELGDSTTNLLTNTPVNLRVNGPTLQNSGSGVLTSYGWCNASPLGGNYYYSSYWFMTNNPSSNENWRNNMKMTEVSVRGFAELYYKPVRPYALRGFAIHFREDVKITKPITLTIFRVSTDANGYLSAFNGAICSQTISPEEFMASGMENRVYAEFYKLVDAQTNEVVNGFTIDSPILVAIKLSEDDTESQFGAYYTALSVDIPTHTYVIYNGITSDGTEQKSYYKRANLNWNNGTYTRAFALFSLMGSFEYLVDEKKESESTYQVPVEGEGANFLFYSSVPYKDIGGINPNWKVTQVDGSDLPSWLRIDMEDLNDDSDGVETYANKTYVSVSTSANDGAGDRSCDVKLSFLGANYILHVVQDGTSTTIKNVVSDDNEADAPVYNMMGQRVGANAKGVLIRNGKKIIVK